MVYRCFGRDAKQLSVMRRRWVLLFGFAIRAIEKFDRRAFLETTSDDTRDSPTTNVLPSNNINDSPATSNQ